MLIFLWICLIIPPLCHALAFGDVFILSFLLLVDFKLTKIKYCTATLTSLITGVFRSSLCIVCKLRVCYGRN